MKYNININQKKALEWNLSSSEAIVFSWLYELASWADRVEYNGFTYYFASRNKAMEELPIITNRSDTMYRLFRSLQDKNIIKIILLEKRDYIYVTEKGKEWYGGKISEKNPSNGNKIKEAEKNPTNNNTNKRKENNSSFKEEEREYKETEEPCSHSCQVLDTNNNGGSDLKNSKLNYDAILAEWKNENPNLPSIRLIDAKRQKKILTLLKNNKSNIDEMFKVMRIIGISDFLQGKNDRGWTATFDWLINDTKGCYQKLLAGEYLKTRMEKEDYAGIMRGEIINNKTLYYDREKRKEKYQ